MRGTGVTVKDGGRGRCMLSTRMSALSWHSLWCGWVWCAQAVQWGDRSSMYAKGKEAHELCGTSITHSLARLSKMTLGSCAPTGPSGCTLAEWSHLPFQRAECDQFQDKMLRAEDCPETWNWLSLFFSAVQIYQAIARKGTESIKLRQAQDQGPQSGIQQQMGLMFVQC